MADADVIVVGAGLAGLVAAAEAADAGRSVLVLDQEPPASVGGQAWWALGGLFLVDSPEQRRLGIKDSAELALSDWMNTAGFDRPEDHWPRQWAEAFVDFAAGEQRAWLRSQRIGLFPLVMWAERGGALATDPGNSVPRFHLAWGTGPAVLVPFLRRVMTHVRTGRIHLRFRHRVTELVPGGPARVAGEVLEPSSAARGEDSSRVVVGDFALEAGAVIVTSGGIGGNHELVRQNWPGGPGAAPAHLISGVPMSTDGLMLQTAERSGGNLINRDRMWHYPEGLNNHTPVWSGHGIRVLSGPSPLWLDATGHRLPAPLFPGFDTGAALRHITASGHSHSWFLLDTPTIAKEFSLSGSEQNPDFTGKSVRGLIARARGAGAQPTVQAFIDAAGDVVTADTLPDLVAAMNALTGEDLVDGAEVERVVLARDAQVRTELACGMGKDSQLTATIAARRYVGDRRMRTVAPHEMLDPAAGPLIAVRLHILTRKTLGGLETDLDGRVLRPGGEPLPGVYAAGEAAGFGGGGMHGYRALEGTFLGGCLFSGRTAGRAAAAAV